MSESTAERARAARRLARTEIAVAVAGMVAVGVLYIAEPAMTPPMFADARVEPIPIGVAFFGFTLGLARMIWIYLHEILPAFDEDD